jgi:hypothetical protein
MKKNSLVLLTLLLILGVSTSGMAIAETGVAPPHYGDYAVCFVGERVQTISSPTKPICPVGSVESPTASQISELMNLYITSLKDRDQAAYASTVAVVAQANADAQAQRDAEVALYNKQVLEDSQHLAGLKITNLKSQDNLLSPGTASTWFVTGTGIRDGDILRINLIRQGTNSGTGYQWVVLSAINAMSPQDYMVRIVTPNETAPGSYIPTALIGSNCKIEIRCGTSFQGSVVTVQATKSLPTSTAETISTLRTLICIKGILEKRITAINPTCPAGYKKK